MGYLVVLNVVINYKRWRKKRLCL